MYVRMLSCCMVGWASYHGEVWPASNGVVHDGAFADQLRTNIDVSCKLVGSNLQPCLTHMQHVYQKPTLSRPHLHTVIPLHSSPLDSGVHLSMLLASVVVHVFACAGHRNKIFWFLCLDEGMQAMTMKHESAFADSTPQIMTSNSTSAKAPFKKKASEPDSLVLLCQRCDISNSSE